MPKPKYVLCCEAISHDKTSNLISHFSVLEGFQIVSQQLPLPEAVKGQALIIPVPIMRFTGVAVWERSSVAEGGGEFDYEIELHIPGIESPSVRSGTFSFKSKQNYRFNAQFEIAPSPKLQSGDVRFVSKVRACGTAPWKSQEYTFPLTVEYKHGDAEITDGTDNLAESNDTPK